MTFSIQYLRHGKQVWETNWTPAIPPSCHFVRYSLMVHNADTAIILDEDGCALTIETRQKQDA